MEKTGPSVGKLPNISLHVGKCLANFIQVQRGIFPVYPSITLPVCSAAARVIQEEVVHLGRSGQKTALF